MTEQQVYLWLMLDRIQALIIIGLIFSCMLSVIATLIWIVNQTQYPDDREQEITRKSKFSSLACIGLVTILSVLLAIVPNSRQYAIIKVMPKMVNSELSKQIQQDVPEVYAMAKEALRDIMSKPKEGETDV